MRSAAFVFLLAGCAASADGAATGAAALDGVRADASSKGSGGLACASTGHLPAGRTYCLTSAGGAEMKVAAPAGGAGPLKLALYLHGDGAGAYKSDSAMKAILPWADANHALVASVLAPNRCAWWQLPTQTNCSDGAAPQEDTEGVNADALKAAIDAIRAAYDVTDGPVFYYGSSGGSIFLTRSFLRRFGNAYPGAYALNCGGEKADRAFAWNVADAALRGPTKLFYTYGDKDYLQADIQAAIPFYEGLGFPSDTKVVPGAEHCAFDGHARAVEVWNAYLAAPAR